MTPEEARKLLPEADVDFLEEKEITFDLVKIGGELHFIYHSFELPGAYTPNVVDLRITLPSGYPNAELSMFWTKPWVKVAATKADPNACSHPMTFPPDPDTWQRWSRHFPGGWRQGIDGLRTYLAVIRSELSKGQ
jgi:hypothetical protein